MRLSLFRSRRGVRATGRLLSLLALLTPGVIAPVPLGAAPFETPVLAVVKTYVVTSTADTPGDCTTVGSPTCTLQQAITDSNANPPGAGNTNLITFAIGTGLQTIRVTGIGLPILEQPVVIDGTTQPGGGTTPRIELTGDPVRLVPTGLRIVTGNVTVKGLVINRFNSAGISITPSIGVGSAPNPGNVTLQGNFLGTNATGTTAVPNGVGVEIDSVPNNLIGGTTTGAGNLISGNRNGGISVAGSGSTPAPGNVIQGNLIGTSAAGTAALPNEQCGICILAQNVTIGGTAPGAGNVISGNRGFGIVFVGSSFNVAPQTGTVIQGNFVGTDRTGTLPLGNSGTGIATQTLAHDNTIGGTTPGAGNTIAFNTGAGVAIGVTLSDTSAIGNAVLGNTIYSNTGGGIVLGNRPTLPNDPQDPDPGPNHLQNYPIITSATSGAGGTSVAGTFNSNPNQPFRLEFFASPAPGSGTIGQGQQVLGFVSVTTDASGNASFTFTTPTVLPSGQVVIATATNTATNDTSGFSQLFPVTGGASVTPTSTGVATAIATATVTPVPATPTPTPVIPELPPLALFASGLFLLGTLAYRTGRRR